MALGISNILASGHTTSATSVIITIPAISSPLSMVVLAMSYDNSGGSGADPYSSIGTDSRGNTWTSRVNALRDPGAASAGLAFRIFTTNQNVAHITAAATVQINFTTACAVKVYTITEITNDETAYPSYGTGAAAASTVSTQTATSITTSSRAVGEVVIGAAGVEYGTALLWTGDTDSTNGTWTTMQMIRSGTTTSGTAVISQAKLITGSGAQTYNTTFSPANDWCNGWISITRTAKPPPKAFAMFLD